MGGGQRADGVTHIEGAACAAQLLSDLRHVDLELGGELVDGHEDVRAAVATTGRTHQMPEVLLPAPGCHQLDGRVPSSPFEVDVDHADLGAKPAHDRRHRALSDQPQTVPQRGDDDAGDPLVMGAQGEPSRLGEQELVEVGDDTGDTPSRDKNLRLCRVGVWGCYSRQQKATSLLRLGSESRDLRLQVFALHRLRAAAGKRRLSRCRGSCPDPG